MRGTPPNNYHLTLAFLGQAKVEVVRKALHRLSSTLSEAESPARIQVAGWGAFPSLHSARVLWAGAEGGAELLGLATAIKQACAPIAPEMDSKPLHPHITVARAKEPVDLTRLTYEFEPHTWIPTAFHMYSTVFRSGRAEYSVEDSWPLRA